MVMLTRIATPPLRGRGEIAAAFEDLAEYGFVGE